MKVSVLNKKKIQILYYLRERKLDNTGNEMETSLKKSFCWLVFQVQVSKFSATKVATFQKYTSINLKIYSNFFFLPPWTG